MSRVTIAIPNQGEIRAETVAAIVRLLGDERHEIRLDLTTRKHSADNCRNHIVRHFLLSDGEYLLMIDADNPPIANPPVNPLDLVDDDLDVVCFPTPIYKPDNVGSFAWQFNVYDDCGAPGWSDIESPRVHGATVEEIGAGGTGCILIARRVLEKVRPPFIRTWDDDGCIVEGSDLLFCRRAREAGFRVHTSWEHHCHHYTVVDQASARYAALIRDISWANLSDKNTPTYWDEQWSGRPERVLPFYSSIAKLVGGKRVLDYGCGRGDLLAMLGSQARGYDPSPEAVTICRERGLMASIEPSVLLNRWDAIVCCEVLEHVDDPEDLLRRFFASTDLVVYSVPNNCMPPGMEREHRRVFTRAYCERITPHIREITAFGAWMVVVAERRE